MEFRDLKKQYSVVKSQMDAALANAVTEARFISGPQVRSLEERMEKYTGRKHCISCANGTDALVIMLKAWGIGSGDAVFVPDFTFFATGECVSMMGATPIFVDVCKDTFNIDVNSLKEAVTAVKKQGKLSPKAVIPVDLFGLPADYDGIMEIAKEHGLRVLEDAAQGFGGMMNDKKACGFGNAATTSFFPAKPLGCYGDGGAIFTDSDDEAALLRSLCVHGKGAGGKYDNVRIGYNSRLDTLQAAILHVKMDVFDAEVKAVNNVASEYTRLLKDVVKTPIIPAGYYSSWAQYTICLDSEEQRDSLSEYLKEKGIPTMVYYMKTMREQAAFDNVRDMQVVSSPVAEKLCRTVLSLPMHPYLEESEIKAIANAVKEGLLP